MACHRGDFKAVPTREPGGSGTDVAGEEEDGEKLEMIPLTQANSPESGSGGGGDLVLQDGHFTGSRAVGRPGDENTPGSSEAVGDEDAGVAEDTQGEGHRLLSFQRGNSEQTVFKGEAGRTHAPISFHGHVESLRSSGEAGGIDMDGSGAESGRLGRIRRRGTSACWQECLVPVKLLQDRRTRAIVFVYSIFSVRCRADRRCTSFSLRREVACPSRGTLSSSSAQRASLRTKRIVGETFTTTVVLRWGTIELPVFPP